MRAECYFQLETTPRLDRPDYVYFTPRFPGYPTRIGNYQRIVYFYTFLHDL